MQNKILFLLITFFVIPNLVKSQNASFTLNNSNATYCLGDTVLFTNTSSGNVYSYWRFGDEFETYVNNPKHNYEKSGSYEVWLIVTNSSGLKDSTNKQITVNPAPKINLINNTDEQYLLVSTGLTEVQFIWYLGNSKTDETDSIVYYLEAGSYSVVAYNQFCRDSSNIKLNLDSIVTDVAEIIVKNNILTPDLQDGANDVLFIDGLGNYDFPVEIYIYNKWGQLVYKNLEYINLGGFVGDDNNGKKLDAGTYYYVVKSEGRKGGAGFVDIIR